MSCFKMQYWKYSLIAIILLLGVIIFLKITPFLGGLMGAATLYLLLRGQMLYLIEKHHWRKSIVAILLLIESLLLFLIPIGLVVWLLISKAQAVNLNPASLLEPVQRIATVIQEKTGYDIMSEGNLNDFISLLPKIVQFLMGSITSFTINVLVLLLVLYFMFTSGRKMENYIREIMPFSRKYKRDVTHELRMVIRSNAIGVPLLAIIQGAAAYLGYLIFGAPEALLWGILSCFATIIPILGVGLVWVPLALYIGISGHWGMAIGLAIYSLIVVGNLDNLIRSMLQKKMADTHPLITIFGVFIGLSLFGFMGVIFGPVLLAIFVLCIEIFREEYLDDDLTILTS